MKCLCFQLVGGKKGKANIVTGAASAAVRFSSKFRIHDSKPCMAANLTYLEVSFEELENHLLNLEDFCGQCELGNYNHRQSISRNNWKVTRKIKRKERENSKA